MKMYLIPHIPQSPYEGLGYPVFDIVLFGFTENQVQKKVDLEEDIQGGDQGFADGG